MARKRNTTGELLRLAELSTERGPVNKQDLAANPAKTKGTAAIDKYTKQYLATVKKKNVVSSK